MVETHHGAHAISPKQFSMEPIAFFQENTTDARRWAIQGSTNRPQICAHTHTWGVTWEPFNRPVCKGTEEIVQRRVVARHVLVVRDVGQAIRTDGASRELTRSQHKRGHNAHMLLRCDGDQVNHPILRGGRNLRIWPKLLEFDLNLRIWPKLLEFDLNLRIWPKFLKSYLNFTNFRLIFF